MPKPQIWLFGNIDFAPDALPLKLQADLQKALPDFDFIVKDPNEEWDLPPKLIIIDTVQGLDKITTFTSLDQFQNTPNITVHDFDLLTNLKWLAKLDKLPPFLIIGLPAELEDLPADIAQAAQAKALDKIINRLSNPKGLFCP